MSETLEKWTAIRQNLIKNHTENGLLKSEKEITQRKRTTFPKLT